MSKIDIIPAEQSAVNLGTSVALSAAAAPSTAPPSSTVSGYKKMLYDGIHYARHGYTKDTEVNYTINPNDTDTERIQKIEKSVYELDKTIKNSGSISRVARNALISYIITYILFAIIIILNVSVLMKKACQSVSTDTFSIGSKPMRPRSFINTKMSMHI
jgi:hypothetical protein